MKWRNLKTNPPNSGTKVLIRVILNEYDEIRGTQEYRITDQTYHIRLGARIQYKNEYLIDENDAQWPYHYFASIDVYYIPIDELKQIEIDKP